MTYHQILRQVERADAGQRRAFRNMVELLLYRMNERQAVRVAYSLLWK